MSGTTVVNTQEADYWNADMGQCWVSSQGILDTLLAAVDEALLARAAPQPGERALDIGCGTGATTLQIAERVGAQGAVTGVDLSVPMLARARERAAALPQVTFVQADAQVHRFEPGGADLVASRFGVMFFDDPVAAFANLCEALAPGGRICCIAWGPLAGNPWFTVARNAAIARVGAPQPQPPTAPGPLAFADRARVRDIIRDAGFEAVEADEVAADLVWPGAFQTLVDLATTVGPARRILKEKGGGPQDAAAVTDAVAQGLAAFRGPAGVRVPAVLNLFSARRA